MIIFLIKLIAAPLLLALATLAARRWGTVLGGILIGLPLISGPISVFLAIENGAGFAVETARGALAGTATLHTFIPRTLTISPNMRKQSTPQSLLRMHLPMQHLDSAEKVTVHSQSQAVPVKDLQVQVHSPREDAA